jgi:predicted DNA-binding protein with PD1-like motif
MNYKKINQGFIVRLNTGEELLESLEKFILENKIKSGWINGIGGVQKATVGYFNTKRQKYVFRAIKDPVEVVSMQGNISWIGENLPIIHLHGVITNMQNKARGGHINKLVVGATLEIIIQTFDQEIYRKPNKDVGLPLLDL